MSKAEEAAVRLFPHPMYAWKRMLFIQGYEQAEKDCALIPEDMGVIFSLVRRCQSRFGSGDAAYEEALRLFNKARNHEHED